jgi:hypothetical protein
MSRKANHRYLRELWLRAFRPRLQFNSVSAPVFVVVLVIVALLSTFGLRTPTGLLAVQLGIPLVTVIGLVACFAILRSRAARAYISALQSPTPDALIALLEKLMARAAAIPDADAFRAQSIAIGYTLYARAGMARAALSGVRWSERAPLIQAVGLGAESLIALFCDEDVERGLELTRRARSLSELGRTVPGSTATRRYHECNAALAEVLAGNDAEEHVQALLTASAAKHLPSLQVIAYAGLVTWAQRQGDRVAIETYRSELRALVC